MIRFSTASGAVYQVDEIARLVRRVGPPSPGIDYATTPDDSWEPYEAITDVVVGASVVFQLHGVRHRVTTPVVAIERGGA